MCLNKIISYIKNFNVRILNYKINKQLKCNNKLKVDRKCRFYGIENIKCGKNVFFGENAFVKAEGGLLIGDNVIISRNLVLYTHNHNYEGKFLPFDDTFKMKPVIIGSNTWIGMNVTIAPGTNIGEGAIIGLGANVFGHIPDFSIVGSNGKIIGYRNKEHYNILVKDNKFADSNGHFIEFGE